MRAAALEVSVPGAMTASVRTDGVPDEAKGALSSWRDGPAKKAILAFVATACGQDGVLAAHAGVRVEDFEARADTFLSGTQNPTLGRGYLDDGPAKPIRIWSRTGRRPLLAAGNSNGDISMLDFTRHQDKPLLRLRVLHHDAEREFAYTPGAELALEQAAAGWTTVSVRDDWATVF